jgi:hypothetical protein
MSTVNLHRAVYSEPKELQDPTARREDAHRSGGDCSVCRGGGQVRHRGRGHAVHRAM